MSRQRPLPPELSHYANLHDLTWRGSGEWSAACPHCGGSDRVGSGRSDRFRLFAAGGGHNARVWCRRCGFFEWADQDARPDPARIAQARELQAAYAQAEELRVARLIERLREETAWQVWHAAMSHQQRAMWHEQGIIDHMIDYYSLGYNPEYTYRHDGHQYHSPTMTIPHYQEGWELVNVQHRLIKPANGAGKYRQTAGLPAAMFRTEPDDPLRGAVLVVEGAKKAIVTYTHLGTKPIGFPMQIVAVPSKTPGHDLLGQLANCEPVYLVLDPDAYTAVKGKGRPAVNRLAELLGRERVRVVKLPCKPDDLLTRYKGTAEDLRHFLKQAVSV